MSLLDFLYEIEDFVHEKRIGESIKSFIPGVGFKYYKEARTDPLTEYPNWRDFREELNYLNSKPRGSVAIFHYDIHGLKQANDTYGFEHGNILVLLGLMILERSINDFGLKGKVYREYGDEGVAIVRNIDEKIGEKISERVELYYKLINIRTESILGRKYSVDLSEDDQVVLWVDKIIEEYNLPVELACGASIGYSVSPEGKDLYSYLDEARKMCKLNKKRFYDENPEFGTRKNSH